VNSPDISGRRAIRAVLTALVLTLLSGCGTTYVLQAARGQWQVMRESEPIDKVLSAPGTSEALRGRLTEVQAARAFATTELGLPENDSYRTYADVGRPYVVWNVVATPEFSVRPQRWCFPVAGCVAYRGYFSERKARAFADRLRKKGFDVTLGGVPAYSTLGRFSDPVLNTMLGYGNNELAAIIFHELAHQVLYVAGDSEFNEAFAETVEQAGIERWLKAHGREQEMDKYRVRGRRQMAFMRVFAQARTDLAQLYSRSLSPEEMRVEKARRFEQLRTDIQMLEKRLGVRSPYRAWYAEGLNNAHLASVATYYDCVPGFRRVLVSSGNDLQKFFTATRELATLPKAQRHAQLCTTVGSEPEPAIEPTPAPDAVTPAAPPVVP